MSIFFHNILSIGGSCFCIYRNSLCKTRSSLWTYFCNLRFEWWFRRCSLYSQLLSLTRAVENISIHLCDDNRINFLISTHHLMQYVKHRKMVERECLRHRSTQTNLGHCQSNAQLCIVVGSSHHLTQPFATEWIAMAVCLFNRIYFSILIEASTQANVGFDLVVVLLFNDGNGKEKIDDAKMFRWWDQGDDWWRRVTTTNLQMWTVAMKRKNTCVKNRSMLQ